MQSLACILYSTSVPPHISANILSCGRHNSVRATAALGLLIICDCMAVLYWQHMSSELLLKDTSGSNGGEFVNSSRRGFVVFVLSPYMYIYIYVYCSGSHWCFLFQVTRCAWPASGKRCVTTWATGARATALRKRARASRTSSRRPATGSGFDSAWRMSVRASTGRTLSLSKGAGHTWRDKRHVPSRSRWSVSSRMGF